MNGKATVVKAAEAALILALVLACLGCSEPDKRVSRSTADGEFELVLEAERNWVVPNGSLPVKVVVRSLAGPLADGLVDQVTFVVNNGDVSPRNVTAIISQEGLEGDEAETEYLAWVTFTAARDLSTVEQGRIDAIFRDALATLKIRIVAEPGTR